MGRDVRRKVASVGDDAVAHEFVSLVGGKFVNALPESAQRGQRFGSVSAGINEYGLVVERAEASIQVITVAVDELKRDDRNSQFGHCRAKFVDTRLRRTKTIAGIDTRPVRVPK